MKMLLIADPHHGTETVRLAHFTARKVTERDRLRSDVEQIVIYSKNKGLRASDRQVRDDFHVGSSRAAVHVEKPRDLRAVHSPQRVVSRAIVAEARERNGATCRRWNGDAGKIHPSDVERQRVPDHSAAGIAFEDTLNDAAEDVQPALSRAGWDGFIWVHRDYLNGHVRFSFNLEFAYRAGTFFKSLDDVKNEEDGTI